ncbi:hypothetical protein [Nocardioides sp.]|uniref:hypothetical protein n=1 Tax=Nocardioides sp. TaxID=35761 RepID=UPI0025E8207D|nr:hypothetical protein [Nocardioides sp.]
MEAGRGAGSIAIGPVACVQNQYGLTTRREDDALLRLCGEHGVAFVPVSSIGAAVAGATPGTADPAHRRHADF